MKIPYSRQSIDDSDIRAVKRTLSSEFITQGSQITKLEKKLCDYTSSKYSTLVNSATSALHLSCLALEVGSSDIVWTSPISFVASANCAVYCGAKIDFIDINPQTFNICTINLEKKLIFAKKNNCLPKVIILVHLAGNPCDLKKIYTLSKKYRFRIIEDASHALGSIYNNHKIGSCKFSDITIFSFHPVKIITTGEGGAILTNQKNINKLVKSLRSHGITKEKKSFKRKIDGAFHLHYYEMQLLGFNYRMNDIEAALGISQFNKLETFIKKRNMISDLYKKLLVNLPLTFQKVDEKSRSSYHLFIIKLNSMCKKIYRDKIINNLLKKNIMTNLHYIPIYRHPFYQSFGYKLSDYPTAEDYFKSAISLPIYPDLSLNEVKKICKIIKSSFKEN